MISFTVTIASFLVVLNKGGILSETLSEGQSGCRRGPVELRSSPHNLKGSSTQAICRDRGRPRPQRAAGAQVLNCYSSFRASRSLRAGAPAVPANHLTGLQLTALTIRQVVVAKANDVKSFAAKKIRRSRADIATSFRQVDIPIRTSSPS